MAHHAINVCAPLVLEAVVSKKPLNLPIFSNKVKISFTGLFCIVVGFFYLATSPIKDGDFWWHLAAGRQIAEMGNIPRVEIFSHTLSGTPWIDFEWLFQLILYKLYIFAGFSGLQIFKISLSILAIITLVYSIPLARKSQTYFMALFWLSLQSMFPRIMMRPELFSFFFLACFIKILNQQSKLNDPKRQKLLPWIFLIFLTMVWSNIHAGFVTGLMLIAIHLVGNIDTRKNTSSGKFLGVILFLCFIATLVNPFGIGVWKIVVSHLTISLDQPLIHEWKPPGAQAGTGLFWIIFIASLCILTWRWFYQIKRLEITEAGILLFFGLMALSSVRHTTLFFWVIIPILSLGIEGFWLRIPKALRLGIALLPSLFFLKPVLAQETFNAIALKRYPEQALKFLDQIGIEGNGHNAYRFGGFITWKSQSQRKIFYDGRYLFYDLLREEKAVKNSARSWKEYLNRYKITYVIEEYPSSQLTHDKKGLPLLTPLSIYRHHFFPQSEWALVWWDDTCLIYVKRISENQSIIDLYEYKRLDPTDLDAIEIEIKQGQLEWKVPWQEWIRHHEETGHSVTGDFVKDWLIKRKT